MAPSGHAVTSLRAPWLLLLLLLLLLSRRQNVQEMLVISLTFLPRDDWGWICIRLTVDDDVVTEYY